MERRRQAFALLKHWRGLQMIVQMWLAGVAAVAAVTEQGAGVPAADATMRLPNA